MVRTFAIFAAVIGAMQAPAATAETRLPATEFSSQQIHPKKKGVTGPQGQPSKPGVTRTAPVNRNINVNRNVNINRNVNVNRNVNINVNRNVNVRQGGPPPGGGKSFQRVGGPGGPAGARQFKPPAGPGAPTVQRFGGPGPTHKFAPIKAGPGHVVPLKVGHVPVVRLGNKVAPVWKGPKKIYWSGRWRTFVPLAALGAVVIGGSYYYADSYLTVARPYCSGVTPEGCRLNWQRVDFEDGDSEWQCVSYCRRPGAPPPPRTVALVAPPPVPQGGACELSIYSEPGFAGVNATASDEQPNLGELGWQNQIASIKVAAGTWDFFSEPQFTGDVVRYGPGEYPDLGPDWSRRAGSFMCVQP